MGPEVAVPAQQRLPQIGVASVECLGLDIVIVVGPALTSIDPGQSAGQAWLIYVLQTPPFPRRRSSATSAPYCESYCASSRRI